MRVVRPPQSSYWVVFDYDERVGMQPPEMLYQTEIYSAENEYQHRSMQVKDNRDVELNFSSASIWSIQGTTTVYLLLTHRPCRLYAVVHAQPGVDHPQMELDGIG
jgi:hypothetical protein